MKLIGLLGGIGWEATAGYCRMMNDYARKELGEQHSARILMHSIDFGAITGDDVDRRELDRILVEAGRSLKAGGADFVIMAANRMHQVANRISREAGFDLLHIADPVGSELMKDGCRKVALLGTRLAMESDFYSQRLDQIYGISVIVPDAAERAEIDRIIRDELSHGIVRGESRTYAGDLISRLNDRGAEAVILGCSEITMVVPPDCDVMPVYDSTRLHARAAVRRSIGVSDA